ncbi:MAG: GlsB/YeaQ/YmgE family stress response membrane protein [Chitinophagaceae bacterium]|nr:GlsB/YeaQ/YmgE family stress response membrane protein [Chitinophagaceae bacterium]
MHFIWFIIIGGVAGWLAGLIMKGEGFGLIGNIIIGILGALIGGWLAGEMGIRIGRGLGGRLLVSTGGAVVLLFLINLVRKGIK